MPRGILSKPRSGPLLQGKGSVGGGGGPVSRSSPPWKIGIWGGRHCDEDFSGGFLESSPFFFAPRRVFRNQGEFWGEGGGINRVSFFFFFLGCFKEVGAGELSRLSQFVKFNFSSKGDCVVVVVGVGPHLFCQRQVLDARGSLFRPQEGGD